MPGNGHRRGSADAPACPTGGAGEHLVASYIKVRGLPWNAYRCGPGGVERCQRVPSSRCGLLWEGSSESAPRAPLGMPDGHDRLNLRDRWRSGGNRWVMFCNPFPPACAARQPSRRGQNTNTWERTRNDRRTLRAAGDKRKRFPRTRLHGLEPPWRKPMGDGLCGGGPESRHYLGEVWYAEADAPTGAVGSGGENPEPRQLHLLQSGPCPGIHDGERTRPLLIFEGTYSAGVQPQPATPMTPAIQLQPDSLPAGPGRPPSAAGPSEVKPASNARADFQGQIN